MRQKIHINICLLSVRLPGLCNTAAMAHVYITILWVYEGRLVICLNILCTSPGRRAFPSCSQYKVHLNWHDTQSGKIFTQHRLMQCWRKKLRRLNESTGSGLIETQNISLRLCTIKVVIKTHCYYVSNIFFILNAIMKKEERVFFSSNLNLSFHHL